MNPQTPDEVRRLIKEAAQSKRFRKPFADSATPPDSTATGLFGREVNRSCGDEIEVMVELRGDAIYHLDAKIKGCLVTSAAWTQVASSMQTLSLDQARELLRRYLRFLDANSASNVRAQESNSGPLSSGEETKGSPAKAPALRLEELPPALSLLSGFRRPSPRRDCARLPALALLAALSKS